VFSTRKLRHFRLANMVRVEVHKTTAPPSRWHAMTMHKDNGNNKDIIGNNAEEMSAFPWQLRAYIGKGTTLMGKPRYHHQWNFLFLFSPVVLFACNNGK
jgi:hypothetical protein